MLNLDYLVPDVVDATKDSSLLLQTAGSMQQTRDYKDW
jgi:hypothetical protein